jgi:hypothetical protein
VADWFASNAREKAKLEEELRLHKQALVWAVGTGKLPATCPGHFMHLLIEAKVEVDRLNTVQLVSDKLNGL